MKNKSLRILTSNANVQGYDATYHEKWDKRWEQRQEIFMQRTRCKGGRVIFMLNVEISLCRTVANFFLGFRKLFVLKLFVLQGFSELYKDTIEKTWSERKDQFGGRQKCKFSH